MGTGIDITRLRYDDPRFRLYNNLQSDAARFSVYRQARKQRELDAAPDDAARKKIEKKYTEWLKTEKQGAFANAAAAEQWAGFAENADLYPNLQYRTVGDADVRPSHALLHGLILPLNDPFWITHTPPLGFGCRCWVTQTDRPVKRNENYLSVPAESGFDFNPGIEQRIFADSAGYYKGWSYNEMKILNDQSKSMAALIVKENVLEYVRDLPNEYKMGEETIYMSNHDAKSITIREHMFKALRNALLFDLQNVLNKAVLYKEKIIDVKMRPEKWVKWSYYTVEGYENMYLNIGTTPLGIKKLHALTDSVKE